MVLLKKTTQVNNRRAIHVISSGMASWCYAYIIDKKKYPRLSSLVFFFVQAGSWPGASGGNLYAVA